MHPRQGVGVVGCVGCVGGAVGLVVVVGTVTVLVGGSVGLLNSSSFTWRRLLRVLPMTSLSNTSASVRVLCRILVIFRVGGGGGTVGQVTTVGGVVAAVVGVAVVVAIDGCVVPGGGVVVVGESVGKSK